MTASDWPARPTAPLTAVQIDRIAATLNLMLAAGEDHFDMTYWFRVPDYDNPFRSLDDAQDVSIGECGTTACLAGFAVLAGAPTHRDADDYGGRHAATMVAAWLGMPDVSMFLTADWPKQLRARTWAVSPFRVITEHMSEIVRGVRRHWFDFDTAAIEQADRQDVDR